MPPLILSGAVLACGALLLLAGAAKLYRAARREDGGGAVRAALRISPRRWRCIEPAAGLVEAATGAAVCASFHPAVAGAALASQGAIFTGLLAYARRAKASGGCGCLRRPKNADAAIAWPVQARAAWLMAAGVIEAFVTLPRPMPLTGAGVTVELTGIGTLVIMLAAEEPWHTPRCRFPIPLRPRTTARMLIRHGVFESMATALGPFAEDFSYRREGCVEEFRFAAAPRPGRADRAVAFRVSRLARGGGLAVEARIEAAAPAAPVTAGGS